VTIEGTFTQLPSVFLIINQAENGCVKQHLTAGTVCTFTIEAAEGWKIHSVTFNGEDVTSQLEEGSIYTTPEMLEDAVLNIAYEQEVPESVENAQASRIKVQGHHGTLRITGATEGTDICVYTTDGMLVAQESAEDGETLLTLPTGQVYIVTVADMVVKIGM
jgi:leucyl aminopeptidase (aminopeptidase T)